MNNEERLTALMDRLVAEADPFMSLDDMGNGHQVLFVQAGETVISVAKSETQEPWEDSVWHVLVSQDMDAWRREESVQVAKRARDEEVVNLVRACNLV